MIDGEMTVDLLVFRVTAADGDGKVEVIVRQYLDDGNDGGWHLEPQGWLSDRVTEWRPARSYPTMVEAQQAAGTLAASMLELQRDYEHLHARAQATWDRWVHVTPEARRTAAVSHGPAT